MNKRITRIIKPIALAAGLCLMGASISANAQSTPVSASKNVQVAWYYGGWGHHYGSYGGYRYRPAYYNNYRNYGNYYNNGGCRNKCVYNWRGDAVRCHRVCWR